MQINCYSSPKKKVGHTWRTALNPRLLQLSTSLGPQNQVTKCSQVYNRCLKWFFTFKLSTLGFLGLSLDDIQWQVQHLNIYYNINIQSFFFTLIFLPIFSHSNLKKQVPWMTLQNKTKKTKANKTQNSPQNADATQKRKEGPETRGKRLVPQNERCLELRKHHHLHMHKNHKFSLFAYI